MKIGIFDSGFGGLTIYKSIQQRLPEYDYLYLGDNARTPYGNRSFETVLKFTTECVNYLFAADCNLIIIACNTASAKALRTIQQKWLPFHYPERRVLGIIRPSVEVKSLPKMFWSLFRETLLQRVLRITCGDIPKSMRVLADMEPSIFLRQITPKASIIWRKSSWGMQSNPKKWNFRINHGGTEARRK